MKICSVKSTVYSLELSVINLHFTKSTCSYFLRHQAIYISIFCISYICKIPKSSFNGQCLKKKKGREKRERYKLNGEQISNIDGRYLMLYYEFRAFIRCMKAAFYRPDFQEFVSVEHEDVSVEQKTGPSIRFQTCGRAFETLNRAFQTLGRAFETLS